MLWLLVNIYRFFFLDEKVPEGVKTFPLLRRQRNAVAPGVPGRQRPGKAGTEKIHGQTIHMAF